MTLRERAQEWLKNYKGAGNAYGGNILSLEEMAAIVSEYLYETDPRKKAEGTNERVEELQAKAELLHGDLVEEQDKRRKLEEALQASEKACDYMGSQLTEARGKISAYEFVIRCNGVSGAEVHTLKF